MHWHVTWKEYQLMLAILWSRCVCVQNMRPQNSLADNLPTWKFYRNKHKLLYLALVILIARQPLTAILSRSISVSHLSVQPNMSLPAGFEFVSQAYWHRSLLSGPSGEGCAAWWAFMAMHCQTPWSPTHATASLLLRLLPHCACAHAFRLLAGFNHGLT